MRAPLHLLPVTCLAFAALLLVPARPTRAFSLLGSNLNPNERDVRVFDEFADATANDNTTPASQFPGQTGAELAIWKGIVEWGSRPHGNGTGDTTQAILGSGAANFDAFWAGAATDIGHSNSNIVSKVNACGSGILAYCEGGFSDGWRIRFCDSWVWNDGPGAISGGQFDLQGVMAHEYGHALGLGHSSVSNATMYPSVGSGSTATRSIEADDIAGVQAIYGAMGAGKPTIVATVAIGGNLVVHGTNFTPTNNQLWFRPSAATGPGSDPRIIVDDLTSNGTVLSAPIPPQAGPGDVIVRIGASGHGSISNAFPTDLVGTFGTPPVSNPNIANVSPSTIDALIPGTAQTVTLSGSDLDLTTAVLLDGIPIAASRYTIVSPSTITLDMPQAATLGAHALGVTDGVVVDEFTVTIAAPALPRYELGTGEPLNVVDRDDGLPFLLGGQPGSTHRILASSSNLPSHLAGTISLAIGNNFSALIPAGDFVIPASGWLAVTVPTGSLVDPGPGGLTFYSQTFEIAFPLPFDVGNLQSMVLTQ